MAYRTLTNLIDGAATLSDIGDVDADSFVTTTEATKYVNEGIAALYDLRLDADGAKLFAVNGPQMTAPTAPAPHVWVLPTDFERLVSLHIYDGGKMHPAVPADATLYAELAADEPEKTVAQYFIREEFGTGTKELYIFPSGITAENVAYTYVKSPPILSLGADTFDGTHDELEFVETYTAIKISGKEESDTAALELRRQELTQRIRNATKDMDLGAPRTIRKLRWRGYRSWRGRGIS